MYQFIISNKNIQLNQIVLNDTTRNQIIDFIHLFDNATVINNNIPNFTKKAFELFNLLKFNTIPKDNHVIIIPDGLLNFVPFETLLNEKTDATSYSKMPFLVKAQNIVYNSSVFFYLTKSKSIKNNKLLGFFPVFNNSEKKLTYSMNEADAIENEMNATLYMNNKATKTNFIKNASNYHILHLSTHASSGNYVTPANIDFYDETLYLNELYSLNINANLVVLSACETGIGTLQKGEGAMSIARGFQYAGAQNLMFSLWQINDLSTSQIMQSFYENYNNTHSAYVSNRQSKLDYLQNEDISNIKKSPYYWGAFVYYGELAKPNNNHQLLYIIIALVILLIIVLLLLKFKKSHGKNITRIPS
jgi:CHAT domain-containing protein